MKSEKMTSPLYISIASPPLKLPSVVAREPVTDPPVPLNIPPIDNRIAGQPSELVGA